MLVSRIMRKPVTTVTPDTSVQAAAVLMATLDVGALAVCVNGHPVGILTDRDIVVRWATRTFADSLVAPIMTVGVATCRADQTVEQAAHLMSDLQIRRLVVLDEAGRIVGMVTLGDIANDADEELAGQTLGEVVETR
ncbi:MAG: CBS domain-containing protein [Rhodobacteraceae bacterium]|nr:MAG: CBS domain-containing protein [Paracoccaceae bacterium]